MPAPHPRMHGLTHVPGGPDPIPNLGGALTTTAQAFPTAATSIAAGGNSQLTWGLPYVGEELLTTSGPLGSTAHPAFVEAGFYSVAFSVRGVSLSDGKSFHGYIVAGSGGTQYFSAVAQTGQDTWAGRTFLTESSSSSTVQVVVYNHDSSTRDFYLESAYVFRLG